MPTPKKQRPKSRKRTYPEQARAAAFDELLEDNIDRLILEYGIRMYLLGQKSTNTQRSHDKQRKARR